MNDLTSILLGLGVLGLVLMLCALPLVAHLLSSVKTIKQALSPQGDVEQRQIGPQPFEVKAATQFTQHGDFLRLEADFKSLRDERKKDVGELHTRIDKLDREMGGVQATLNLNTDHLVRIEAKLDRQ